MHSLLLFISAANANELPAFAINPMQGLDPAVYTAAVGVDSTLEGSLMWSISEMAAMMKV